LPSKRRRRRSKDKSDGNGGTDEWFTQKVTANEIDDGLVRIPQGRTKGLFPPKATDVEIELRGTKLSVKWDPSFARLRGRERSGRLKLDKQVLANTVKVNERLRIEQIGSYIRLS
jgi:hypothetical protein